MRQKHIFIAGISRSWYSCTDVLVTASFVCDVGPYVALSAVDIAAIALFVVALQLMLVVMGAVCFANPVECNVLLARVPYATCLLLHMCPIQPSCPVL
eukprot:15364688-Ditylum_brightwellii.AAC.1